MRNLTIKRAKSFVACLAKMKVYIEDAAAGELNINGVPCRKLGELKNGEQKTFEIGEQAARVYMIVDTVSKDYCNDYYSLEFGQDDVFLSGKNKFNPASGNAFRFDNNHSEGIEENRKKGTKKGLVVLLVAAAIGVAIGMGSVLSIFSNLFSDKPPAPKTFSAEGMSITLTDEFTEVDTEGLKNFTTAYETRDVAVLVLKENDNMFADGMENYTVDDYGEMVLLSSNLSSSEIKHNDGLTYFTYTGQNADTNISYNYYAYIYKNGNNFWLIQFATAEEHAEKYSQQFFEWAKTVRFSK
ncbi:MAG: hypothetical protein IJ370_05245 [Oscillospiraceae bacterium]|nr:hypothetical protein [Oscillospiraceae bacterium]